MRTYAGLAMVLATAILSTSDALGQPGYRWVTIDVTVDGHKPSGSAWDVFGGAPDIALCTNSALGQRCYALGAGVYASPSQFSRSRCPDAFSCTFRVEVPMSGPVGVTIYDVDVSSHDTIGSCQVNSVHGAGACGAAHIVIR